MIWREGVVRSVATPWDGVVELEVVLGPDTAGALPRLGAGDVVRALAYPDLVGTPQAGDRAVLSVATLARGLGTGGFAMVVALPDRFPADPPPGPGHIVKARYTPSQTMVLGVDEQESPWHETLRDADDVQGMPVVAADLHSALPAILAGARAQAERLGLAAPVVAYVMTDGGALPVAFSKAVSELRRAGWLTGTISCGQAYGGDLEAVSVHSALLAARLVLGADIAVLTQGPGNLGTGTRWGFSGVAAGEAVNAAGTLGGRPVAALRVSGADPRARHRGVSHHSLTAYGRVALLPADLVLPVGDEDREELWGRVREQTGPLAAPQGAHRLVEVSTHGLLDALAASPVRLSTMGRSLVEDPAAFIASAAAGAHAARLVQSSG